MQIKQHCNVLQASAFKRCANSAVLQSANNKKAPQGAVKMRRQIESDSEVGTKKKPMQLLTQNVSGRRGTRANTAHNCEARTRMVDLRMILPKRTHKNRMGHGPSHQPTRRRLASTQLDVPNKSSRTTRIRDHPPQEQDKETPTGHNTTCEKVWQGKNLSTSTGATNPRTHLGMVVRQTGHSL